MMLNTGEFDRLVGFARDQPPEARLVSITAIAARHNWPGFDIVAPHNATGKHQQVGGITLKFH
jgi:hypothetical protein